VSLTVCWGVCPALFALRLARFALHRRLLRGRRRGTFSGPVVLTMAADGRVPGRESGVSSNTDRMRTHVVGTVATRRCRPTAHPNESWLAPRIGISMHKSPQTAERRAWSIYHVENKSEILEGRALGAASLAFCVWLAHCARTSCSPTTRPAPPGCPCTPPLSQAAKSLARFSGKHCPQGMRAALHRLPCVLMGIPPPHQPPPSHQHTSRVGPSSRSRPCRLRFLIRLLVLVLTRQSSAL